MEPEIAQNLSVERDEKSAFLIFSSAQPADAGVYECLDLDTGTPSSAVHLQVEPGEGQSKKGKQTKKQSI